MKNKKGFTLIELAVVIFLIGAFFLVAIPKFKDIAQVNIKSASRRLSGIIKYLYSEAAFKKKVYRLVFDIESSGYWIEFLERKGDYNEFVISGDPLLRRKELLTGVYFRDVVTERDLEETNLEETLEGNEEYILFTPTGFVEPAVIYLETENGVVYTIATKPYTGGTIVFDEYVELETLYTGNNSVR
jgi:prepilin-type N-terminal cleavage/methylation domain-containing protein